MAQLQTGIERIAAWFGEYGVMATLLSPTRAVAISSSIPEGEHELRLLSHAGYDDLEPKVLARDASNDLALLEISGREIPESFVPGVYTYEIPPGTGDAMVVEATLLTPHTIGLKPPMLAAIGAPVIAEGKFFGMIREYGGEGSWRCIPAAELYAWASSAAASFDPGLFFSRLTAGGVRALSFAAGAAKGGEVEMDHLRHGLHENYAGTTRRLFRARGVTIPTFDDEPLRLTALPTVDSDVQRALEEAVRLADSRGERQIRGRHILFGALTVEPFANLTPADVQLDDHRSVLGHRADTVDGEDLLDIKREARVLAGVLGASTVEPPISLGLFGEWGSGKSFFMHEMHRQFDALQGTPGHCHNIVQIWFNAWHYIDTPNLWASLAAEIFERLDFELSVRQGARPRDQAAHERAGALAKSAQVRSELAKIAGERTKIESELREVENGLAALQDERVVAKAITLPEVFTAAIDATKVDPKAKQEIEEIDKRFDEARDELHLSERSLAELRQTTDRGRAIVLAAKKLPLISWLLVILFALLIAAGAIVATQVDEAVRLLAGLAGVIASPLIALLTPGGKAVRALFKAWELKERLIEEQRKALEAPLIADHDRLAKELAAKKAEEENKATELQTSEETVARLEPTRQMSNFVAERKKSTDYTRHLGVIASAHDDFAELSRLLRRAATNEDDKSVPPVDRIVLYIDDLDRCPEDKVVDVLQAVHLLLAFPLFIVVVGVDSRWLLHSLQRHLKQFSGQETDELSQTLWASTPLNYLEKIFQIPFTIRRMKVGSFGDLIDNLTRPQNEVARERSGVVTPPPVEDGRSRPSGEKPEERAKEGQAGVPVLHVAAQQQQPEQSVDFLTLTKWETEDMKLMYPLIPSPRAAKRFVNTYRLLRGMIDEYERPTFIGNGWAPTNHYRAALLMLAMLTGYPAETTAIIDELLTTKDPLEDWWAFVAPQVLRNDLREHLETIRAEWDFVPPTSIFRKWAPDVGRFSFHSGRIVSAQV